MDNRRDRRRGAPLRRLASSWCAPVCLCLLSSCSDPKASPSASAQPRKPRADTPTVVQAARLYSWPRRRAGYESLANRFPPPAGFKRVTVDTGSFADWLRHLPVLPGGAVVRDHAGRALTSSTVAAAAVVDLDVGRLDLQQCMDTVMRLRAEYLWQRRKTQRIQFRYAGGKYFSWGQWSRGVRPQRQGRAIVYRVSAKPDSSRRAFRRYLSFLFMMTGTIHNLRELRVAPEKIRAGDFFVQPPPSPGSLGHAIVVLDLARNRSGELRALMGQGYTPAQDLHVLRAGVLGSPWFVLKPGRAVKLPFRATPFQWSDLRRFRH